MNHERTNPGLPQEFWERGPHWYHEFLCIPRKYEKLHGREEFAHTRFAERHFIPAFERNGYALTQKQGDEKREYGWLFKKHSTLVYIEWFANDGTFELLVQPHEQGPAIYNLIRKHTPAISEIEDHLIDAEFWKHPDEGTLIYEGDVRKIIRKLQINNFKIRPQYHAGVPEEHVVIFEMGQQNPFPHDNWPSAQICYRYDKPITSTSIWVRTLPLRDAKKIEEMLSGTTSLKQIQKK